MSFSCFAKGRVTFLSPNKKVTEVENDAFC